MNIYSFAYGWVGLPYLELLEYFDVLDVKILEKLFFDV
jgi:hypothetical protein